MISFRSRTKAALLISPVLSLLLLCYIFWPGSSTILGRVIIPHAHKPPTHSSKNSCPELPGIADVQVVLKTGATEAMHKVPIHFNTTLRCIPHFVLFSDFEEDIGGFHLRDVLRNVNESIKQTVADFNLYNRLREGGRSALTTDDMNDDPSTPNGKPENPGWILDKWKFLPMIDETLRIRDDAKWYIFMEADTYLVWPNLMAWLERFDSRKPYYMGSAVQIGDDVFAHGGSGFVLSNIAMRKVSEYRAARIAEWDAFTNGHWAGDGVLGKALKDAGVNLLRSSSMLQGATPWTFGYLAPGKDKGSWCTPAVSYHHMAPSEIQKMWLFERGWSLQGKNSTLLHSDVFEELIKPRLNKTQDNWDNLSADETKHVAGNLAECEAQCTNDPECLQYSYQAGKCLISHSARYGEIKAGVTSGWIPERIRKAARKLGSCRKVKWITS